MTGEFDNPLVLTTPHIHGPRVKDAQWLLSGHNTFANANKPHQIQTYTGAIDGEYGPESYAATKHAKYWLGYDTATIDGRFGQLIYKLLDGIEPLPAEYVTRRTQRINAAPTKVKALNFAETQIGTKESPFGSNMQKYGAWYGMNGVPWCAIFVSYCLYEVGYKTLQGNLWKYSYVPTIAQDAAMGRNGMSLTKDPQPGDLVSYTFRGIPNAHVAFFSSWVNPATNHFYFNDLAGNTGMSNLANGGEVLSGEQNISYVTHFIHLT